MKRYIFTFILSLTAFLLDAQTLRVKQKAPNIIQKSLSGETLDLSSLKGKMVLIDFWASWCGPCRRENPTVVKAYDKYKNASFKNGEGFVVFSVSLDSKKESWERAIKADGLYWEYHVCDLKGWRNEAAQAYGINSIPSNFLIDGDGTIVAINLRGEDLAAKLNKLKKGQSFWGSHKD